MGGAPGRREELCTPLLYALRADNRARPRPGARRCSAVGGVGALFHQHEKDRRAAYIFSSFIFFLPLIYFSNAYFQDAINAVPPAIAGGLLNHSRINEFEGRRIDAVWASVAAHHL